MLFFRDLVFLNTSLRKCLDLAVLKWTHLRNSNEASCLQMDVYREFVYQVSVEILW